MEECIIYTDGAARSNPGPAGIGIIIQDLSGKTLQEISEYIGETTNNIAEYTALLRGLQAAQELGAKKLKVYSDSELMVNQVNGVYKVKNEGLKPYFDQYRALRPVFTELIVQHIPREKNKRADALSKKGSDQAAGSTNESAAPAAAREYPVHLIVGSTGGMTLVYEEENGQAGCAALKWADAAAKIRFADSGQNTVILAEAGSRKKGDREIITVKIRRDRQ